MTPLQVRLLVYLVAALVLFGAGWAAVHTYNGAIEDAAAAQKERDEWKTVAETRAAEIERWQSQFNVLEANLAAERALTLAREAELAASRAAFNRRTQEYRDALAQLEGLDRDCAARPVPAAVDRLFAPPARAPAGAGDRSGEAPGGPAG
jgi:hypothetical protein